MARRRRYPRAPPTGSRTSSARCAASTGCSPPAATSRPRCGGPRIRSNRGAMVDDLVPVLTADLPGTGGAIRTTADDFVVDEVPAYAPSGTGDHVFVHIEKRRLTTPPPI